MIFNWFSLRMARFSVPEPQKALRFVFSYICYIYSVCLIRDSSLKTLTALKCDMEVGSSTVQIPDNRLLTQ